MLMRGSCERKEEATDPYKEEPDRQIKAGTAKAGLVSSEGADQPAGAYNCQRDFGSGNGVRCKSGIEEKANQRRPFSKSGPLFALGTPSDEAVDRFVWR